MSKKINVLILTDHTGHSSENSLYELAVKLFEHEQVLKVDVASKGFESNAGFFNGILDAKLVATSIDQEFSYDSTNHPLAKNHFIINLLSYDLVWLRLPPPLSEEFLIYIENTFKHAVVINKPGSIHQTGNKAFLMNFSEVCPPMKICHSLEDIKTFSHLFPIVIKPLNEYGGRGIYKIDNGSLSYGNKNLSMADFERIYRSNPIDYLGVKYLKNVKQGDKRIVVVNGVILGASLRLPAEHSWLCNVSMGGTSNAAEIEPEEEEIVKLVDPVLSKLGIVMYGVDTLVGDDGKRVLSEINTTSIGGLPQIAAMRNEPLLEKAIELILKYCNKKIKEYGEGN